MSTSDLLKTCRHASLISLLLGTALLVFFFFANNDLVAFASVPVVLAIGAYNLKLLLQLVWRGRKEKESRKALWQTGAIMSLNFPVALLYTKAVLVLSSTLLVRLVNDTAQPLHQVVVLGCGGQRPLADLQPGQATILWLPTSPPCFEHTVLVQYTAGKATQQAIIDWYVVGGKRVNLKLGSNQAVALTNR
jgi:hypothetical protein